MNPKEKRPEKIKRRVRITIPIVEGDRFYFGKVTVEGSTVFPPANLVRVFEYKPGKPLARSILEDGIKAIDSAYRGRGYIYAFMNPEFTEKPNHIVDVTVRITEGDQYRLGRVEFSGNKNTRDKVLRREFPINEGDIMDMETFKKGLLKVTQLGYFKIEEDPDFRVNPDLKTVDVTVKGTDVNRNEVQFGAGYSEPQGFFGQFSFSTRNFLGRGDTLGLQFQRGSYSNYFDISFVEPYFLDKRMSIGGSIYSRNLQYLDVQNQTTKGVSASVPARPRALGRRLLHLRLHRHERPVPGLSAAAASGRRYASRGLLDFHRKDVGLHAGLRVQQHERPLRPVAGEADRRLGGFRRRPSRRRLLVRRTLRVVHLVPSGDPAVELRVQPPGGLHPALRWQRDPHLRPVPHRRRAVDPGLRVRLHLPGEREARGLFRLPGRPARAATRCTTSTSSTSMRSPAP